MDSIRIKNIEYEYSTYTSLVSIKVTFDFGIIKNCEIELCGDDSKYFSDKGIKKSILRVLDELMERKYIDEI